MSGLQIGPMTCDQATIAIIDALSVTLSDELAEHLAGCASCAKEYEMSVRAKVLMTSASGPAPSRLYVYRLAARNIAGAGPFAASTAARSGSNSRAPSPPRRSGAPLPRPAWRFSPIEVALSLVVIIGLPLAIYGLVRNDGTVGPGGAPTATATATPTTLTPPATTTVAAPTMTVPTTAATEAASIAAVSDEITATTQPSAQPTERRTPTRRPVGSGTPTAPRATPLAAGPGATPLAGGSSNMSPVAEKPAYVAPTSRPVGSRGNDPSRAYPGPSSPTPRPTLGPTLVPGVPHDPPPGVTAQAVSLANAHPVAREVKQALDAGDTSWIRTWVFDTRGALDLNEWDRLEGGLWLTSTRARQIVDTLMSRAPAPPVVEGYFCIDPVEPDRPACEDIYLVVTGLGDIYHVPQPVPSETPDPNPSGPREPTEFSVRIAVWEISSFDDDGGEPNADGRVWKVWWTPREHSRRYGLDEYTEMIRELGQGNNTYYIIR